MRLLHETGVVVALGGGAVTSPLIRERLRDESFTVLLDVSPQTAWRRIEAQAGDRPLAAEARGFAELYEERRGALPRDGRRARRRRGGARRRGAAGADRARRARWPSSARLIGARRAALVADRSVLRMVGAPIEPFVTVRLPVGEAAKTVAVARQAWTRLAEFGLERGDVDRRPRRRRRHRRGRVRRRHLSPRRPLDRGADLAGRDGRRRGGRQDRHRPAVREERGRRLPPARVGGRRSGRARDAAGARVGVRLRRGDQDRAPGRRPPVGDGARLGAGPGHARAAARADPPLRRLQGARRGLRPDRARPPRGAEPGPLDRPRDRGRDRLQGVRARRGGRHRPALGAVALGADRGPRPVRRGGGARPAAPARPACRRTQRQPRGDRRGHVARQEGARRPRALRAPVRRSASPCGTATRATTSSRRPSPGPWRTAVSRPRASPARGRCPGARSGRRCRRSRSSRPAPAAGGRGA